jgi:two-component sensor histidine kinase
VSVGLIVNELVRNAIKYAFPGESPGMIDVTISRNGANVHLSVADNGVGTNAAQPVGGSGMGQRLVASFAQQLGGRVEVQTGKGRSVVINFPASPSEQLSAFCSCDHRPAALEHA